MQFAHADSMLLSRQSPNTLSATAAYLGRYMTWRLTPSNTFWTIAMHFMVGCGVLTDYWVHARAPAIEQLKFCGRPSSPPNREVWHTKHSILCMQCKEIYKPKMCPVSEVSGMNSMLRHMYRVKKNM